MKCIYGVVSFDGFKKFDDPVAALQYAAYMESVGSDSVYYLCVECEGDAKRIKRLSVYDIIKAMK